MEETINAQFIPISEIHADDEFNCRIDNKAIDVVDLAKDIKEKGLMQPVVIQNYTPEQVRATGFKYLLLMGYRRLLAHRVNNETVIKAIIETEPYAIEDAMFRNLSENIHRKDLNILEEARVLEKIDPNEAMTENALAAKINKPRGWVQVRRHLLDLPEAVQEEVIAFNMSHEDIRDMRRIYKATNWDLDALHNAVRKIKDARSQGKRPSNVVARKMNVKRIRSKNEIYALQDALLDVYDTCPATKALAWASGHISDNDFVQYIREDEEDFIPPWER